MTDKQIGRIAKQFRSGILKRGQTSRMMCAAVSYSLQGYLSALGEETECIEVSLENINHVFLRLMDGRILDATADQFGGPPVYLGEPLWYHRNFEDSKPPA